MGRIRHAAICEKRGSIPRSVCRELDASALNRFFSNIISNAVKYSDGDFTVTMTEDGSITFVNSAKELDTVTVGRLYDRFYTVAAGRNSTGLGLSIAKLLTGPWADRSKPLLKQASFISS